jgi:hypothetical protein
VVCQRLYGAKPEYIAYAGDWRVNLGQITGSTQSSFIFGLLDALNVFIYHVTDRDDSLPPTPSESELTALQLVVDSVDISVNGLGSISKLFLKDGFLLQFDNFVTDKWASRLLLDIPRVTLQTLMAVTADNKHMSDTIWVEVLCLDTSLSYCSYNRPENISEARSTQMKFIQREDSESRRCSYLYYTSGYEYDIWQEFLKSSHRGNKAFDPPFPLLSAVRSRQNSAKKFATTTGRQRSQTANEARYQTTLSIIDTYTIYLILPA